jgi:hypothetical protein
VAAWNRNREQEIRIHEQVCEAVPEPRAHRVWVADWTVYIYNQEPLEIGGAYLSEGWERKASEVILFRSQRAPEQGVRMPVEYIVAQIERSAVTGTVSKGWRQLDLGVW